MGWTQNHLLMNDQFMPSGHPNNIIVCSPSVFSNFQNYSTSKAINLFDETMNLSNISACATNFGF